MQTVVHALLRGKVLWSVHQTAKGAQAERDRLVREGCETKYDISIESRRLVE